MTIADEALSELAAVIREDDSTLAAHLRDPAGSAGLGVLAAAGPRAKGAEADYAFVIEAVREGYLLHYGEPRVLGDVDPDLALLAGDHLYALGLERLAGLGDLEAVRELADLISLCAQIHADGDDPGDASAALWLGATAALTAGTSPGYESAKAAVREGAGGAEAAGALGDAAAETAASAGLGSALAQAANSIDFDLTEPPARG